jgi:hypothetical protein
MCCPHVTLTLPPADSEVRFTAERAGGVAVNSTNVSLQRCLLADNPDEALGTRDSGNVRMEGCKFERNAFDINVQPSSVLYTDTPASALSMGCVMATVKEANISCNASTKYGSVLPLASSGSEMFLTEEDVPFVALQLVRLCLNLHHSSVASPSVLLIASYSSPSPRALLC